MKIILGTSETLPVSARVVSVVEGDRVLGIAGVYPDGNRQVVFSTISEELKQHPKIVIKAARMVMKWIKESKMPTHALCDEEIPKAEEFLMHWGFRRIHKGVFSWQR